MGCTESSDSTAPPPYRGDSDSPRPSVGGPPPAAIDTGRRSSSITDRRVSFFEDHRGSRSETTTTTPGLLTPTHLRARASTTSSSARMAPDGGRLSLPSSYPMSDSNRGSVSSDGSDYHRITSLAQLARQYPPHSGGDANAGLPPLPPTPTHKLKTPGGFSSPEVMKKPPALTLASKDVSAREVARPPEPDPRGPISPTRVVPPVAAPTRSPTSEMKAQEKSKERDSTTAAPAAAADQASEQPVEVYRPPRRLPMRPLSLPVDPVMADQLHRELSGLHYVLSNHDQQLRDRNAEAEVQRQRALYGTDSTDALTLGSGSSLMSHPPPPPAPSLTPPRVHMQPLRRAPSSSPQGDSTTPRAFSPCQVVVAASPRSSPQPEDAIADHPNVPQSSSDERANSKAAKGAGARRRGSASNSDWSPVESPRIVQNN